MKNKIIMILVILITICLTVMLDHLLSFPNFIEGKDTTNEKVEVSSKDEKVIKLLSKFVNVDDVDIKVIDSSDKYSIVEVVFKDNNKETYLVNLLSEKVFTVYDPNELLVTSSDN